jgi:hypothetical protein
MVGLSRSATFAHIRFQSAGIQGVCNGIEVVIKQVAVDV